MLTPDYTLLIRTPIHKLAAKTSEAEPITDGDITYLPGVKESWQRNKVWMLGDDIGTFTLQGDIAELGVYYDNWLTYDLVEISSGDIATWNGMITKMILKSGINSRTYDRADMHNRIIATIGDGIGTYTAAANNLYSQDEYGLRIEYIQPGVEETADANGERDTYLKRNAWPSEKPSSGDATKYGKMAELVVYVQGYKETLNDLYADDVTITPANGIATALNVTITGSLYVNARSFATNATKLYDDVELIQAGELVEKLLAVSDSDGSLFRGWIDGYRNFRYEIVDNTPDYVIKGGKVYYSAGDNEEVAPRLMQPGIYRDLDFPISGPHRDSFFADRRDLWVDSVFVNREGRYKLGPEDSQISDYQTLLWSKA